MAATIDPGIRHKDTIIPSVKKNLVIDGPFIVVFSFSSFF
jgi:hypothetical protein